MRWLLISMVLFVGCGADSAGDDSGSAAADSGSAPMDAAGPVADSGRTVVDSGSAVDSAPVDSRVPDGCGSGPLAAPIPGCSPPTAAPSGDPHQDCVDRINQLRAECQCLGPLARWTEGEDCADQHAEYDSTRSAHAGFRDRICTNGGFGQNECPGWRSVDQTISGCLQSMWDEGPGEPFSEHGHYINMTNSSYSMVACGFHTTPDGRVWAVHNFQ